MDPRSGEKQIDISMYKDIYIQETEKQKQAPRKRRQTVKFAAFGLGEMKR